MGCDIKNKYILCSFIFFCHIHSILFGVFVRGQGMSAEYDISRKETKEIVIDKTFVERDNHWPYPNKSGIEDIVLVLCEQIRDPECLSNREIFIQGATDDCRWKPPVKFLQRTMGPLPTTVGWINIRNFSYYKQVRLIYSGVYGSSMAHQVSVGTLYEHGSFLHGDDGRKPNGQYREGRVGEDNYGAMRRLKSSVEEQHVIRKGVVTAPFRKETLWNEKIMTWDEMAYRHSRIMKERVKLIDLCERFLSDAELLFNPCNLEWSRREKNELDNLKEKLMLSGNTFIE